MTNLINIEKPPRFYPRWLQNYSNELILNSIIVKPCFEFILCGIAGVYKESRFTLPFFESPVIVELKLLVYNERNNVVP